MANEQTDAIVGIDKLVYGTSDMAMARKLFRDWGLAETSAGDEELVYACGNGNEVVVKPENAPELPPRFSDGSNFREVVWGVSTPAHLARIGKELERDREVREDAKGALHCTDDTGINIGFRLWSHESVPAQPEPTFNTPWQRRRIDQRATIYEQAVPWRMGHIGFRVDDVMVAERFYVDRLGFWLSDRYADGGATFLRNARRADHHNLFIIRSPTTQTMFDHVAFEVRDIHEVFGGGLAFSRKGWDTHVGPGRHPVSSAYFWYFKNPLGGAIEYFSDTDIATEAWEPVDFQENRFSEWHLSRGIPMPDTSLFKPSIAIARERNLKNKQ